MFLWWGVRKVTRSPSMRRAWIEMLFVVVGYGIFYVALHAEGVD